MLLTYTVLTPQPHIANHLKYTNLIHVTTSELPTPLGFRYLPEIPGVYRTLKQEDTMSVSWGPGAPGTCMCAVWDL